MTVSDLVASYGYRSWILVLKEIDSSMPRKLVRGCQKGWIQNPKIPVLVPVLDPGPSPPNWLHFAGEALALIGEAVGCSHG